VTDQYELIYGFVHCRGRTTYHAGFAKTLSEAEAWRKLNREDSLRTVKVPPEDPIRYCKADFCPLKRQKLWFDIRILPDPEKQ